MEFETWHIVLGLILVALIFLCKRSEGMETNFCGNCRDLTNEECGNCSNCGVCVTEKGCEMCVPGDEAGPYFSNKCIDWKYRGKTPSNKCWNWDKTSPYNCGYVYPYNKRVILHNKYAALPNQLGTNSMNTVEVEEKKIRQFLEAREKNLKQ